MSRPVRRPPSAVAVLVPTLLALTLLGAASAGVAPARADVLRVSVSRAPVTRPLADGFLGVGLEFSTIPEWVRPGQAAVNPVLVQLIRNLSPSGRPVIRIGGQSTDRSWWPAPGQSRPLGVTYALGAGWATAARALAQATGARLLLGLNLEADRPRLDQVEAHQFLTRIGRGNIGALELGNEPPLYSEVPWYKVLAGRRVPWYSHSGTPVYARGPDWSPGEYRSELQRTLAVLPRIAVAGPESSTPPWLDAFGALLGRGSRVRIVTSHAYALNQCVHDPALPLYPSVPHLLSLFASRELLAGLGPYVAAAHRAGAAYRIDEMGSISCNGRRGVSDTMASALWVLDALFALARAGVDGVNLHSFPNSANGLFDFTLGSGGGWIGTIHPLYYGALMFAQAAPAGSRLVAVAGGGRTDLRVWATQGPDHRLRVVLLNDRLSGRLRAALRVPAAFARGAATLERLQAPSAYATSGLTLGARRFGLTRTGLLPPPRAATVPSRAGTFSVTLAPASAALVTFAP